jgi:hypothetical protein
MLLASEHHAWHQELINSRWRKPRIYKPDDIIFACCAVWSDASKDCVGKLEFSFTCPWRIIGSADGGPYNIEHWHHTNWQIKSMLLTSHPIPQNYSFFLPKKRDRYPG